jgi:hypothetical protein
MTIRADALRWLAKRTVVSGGHVVTSRRYPPEESWTRAEAWWVQVPTSAIRAGKIVHIVCEAERESNTFRHLQVPSSFFLQHLDEFATIGEDKINLFLSADEETVFEDQRGSGRISFAEFEQT